MKKTLLFLMLVAALGTSACARTTQNEPAPQQVQTVTDENPASHVKTIPADVAGKDVLATVAKNYEGKVVLVDFWATWCGPCRAAMKTIDAIKPSLAESGVVFVYITGDFGDLDEWTEMIKPIEGDHYRLTKEQWGGMCESLGLRGIPCYLIFGKDGARAWDNIATAGYPGNDVLENEAKVALAK